MEGLIGIEEFRVKTSEETVSLGQRFGSRLREGETVLFIGDLGAGKTTMIRGILAELGHLGPVRSPTFNLIKLYEARIRVMHADLYRLTSAEGLGLEDYLDEYLCLIEWPDRLGSLISPERCWEVEIEFAEEGRVITISAPSSTNS